MKISMQAARKDDAAIVSSILREAARFLDSIGKSLWKYDDLSPEGVLEDFKTGRYFIAYCDREAIGTLKYQLEDPIFWPEIPQGTSSFIHRLAIRRKAASKGVSKQMLDWAKDRTKSLGRAYLRLDCAMRPKLCQLYEKNGFVKHSDKRLKRFSVTRFECDLGSDQRRVE